MGKKNRTKLTSLVLDWEKATPYMLEALVIRTAVFLSAVQDVPKGVLQALDSLGRGDDHLVATNISEILTFLRRLQSLEDMASGNSNKRNGSSKPLPSGRGRS